LDRNFSADFSENLKTTMDFSFGKNKFSWVHIHIGKISAYLHGCGLLGSEKCSVCEKSHSTEVKCSNIPQKSLISYRKRSEMNVKAVIPHFPAETTFIFRIF
jgi:hypothetical protein